MALLDPIKPHVLATKFIPNVAPDLRKELGMTDDQQSIAMFTCDIDDCAYVAIDEATKKAEVKVVYAKSFYCGAPNVMRAAGPLAGEFIGILAGPNPAETKAGLNAAIQNLAEESWFYSANDDDTVAYFAHTISRTGSYLSECAGIPEGDPLAYLIAPPIEAVFGVDAAVEKVYNGITQQGAAQKYYNCRHNSHDECYCGENCGCLFHGLSPYR